MARRGRTGTDECEGTEEGAEGEAVSRDGESSRKRVNRGAREERRSKVMVSLPDELAWRLRTVAAMSGTHPGRLIEPWIESHLRQYRLPYESFKKGKSAAEEVSAA